MKTPLNPTKPTREWLIPVGLVLLSLVPVIAGMVRLHQMGSGAITPENTRFFASPWPVVIHILSVTVYSLLGAFQFSAVFRRRQPKWHRRAGYILLPMAFLTAFSGLWMTLFYPWPKFDGIAVYSMRLFVGMAMMVFLLLSLDAIRKRNFALHGAWMIRAYALALGAGTQVFTHLPFGLFPSIQNETSRAVCMGSAWLINYLVAEWVIYHQQCSQARFSKTKVAQA
ncbi:MAG: DUF2306 domain-containing protein [Candidatus Sericytochromatia bacterium]